MDRKVIYYVPVNKKYIQNWEYYLVDYDILKSIFGKVVICSTFFEFLMALKGSSFVFCWWWHRSTHIVLISKLLNLKTVVTGAIHMYDVSGSSDFFNKSPLFRMACRISLTLADFNLFISQDQSLQICSHLRVNNPSVVYSSHSKGQQPEVVLKKMEEGTGGKAFTDKGKVKLLTVIWHTEDSYKRKGVFETMEALSLIKKELGDCFDWTIAGAAGPGLVLLKRKIQEFGLINSVAVITDLSAEDKIKLYENSDLYVQPSWFEGFGNAVLEAMSFGLPALVSKYTAQTEVVGEAGLVVLELTPQAIYEKLYYFMKLPAKDRRQLATASVSRVINKFTFEQRMHKMRSLFSKVEKCN